MRRVNGLRWSRSNAQRIQAHNHNDQNSGLMRPPQDRPDQPAQVEADGAQHGVQGIAQCPLQPAAFHAMVVFEVTDGRLDGLPPLQPTALRPAQ
jgi:hypothetical protein